MAAFLRGIAPVRRWMKWILSDAPEQREARLLVVAEDTLVAFSSRRGWTLFTK